MSPISDIEKLRKDVKNLRECLITTIAWIAQSANSPINGLEAKKLIELLNRE